MISKAWSSSELDNEKVCHCSVDVINFSSLAHLIMLKHFIVNAMMTTILDVGKCNCV